MTISDDSNVDSVSDNESIDDNNLLIRIAPQYQLQAEVTVANFKNLMILYSLYKNLFNWK